MIITVEDHVPATANVTVEQIAAYLARTGWVCSTDDSVDAEWWNRSTSGFPVNVWLWCGDTAETLANVVRRVATAEGRQPSAVLGDIVGYDIVDRGTAIVRRNSAMARVVDAREMLSRIPQWRAAEHETARVRLVQAEAEAERATRSLRAAEGAMT